MKQPLQRLASQLTRFSLVGVANTGIDFRPLLRKC